MQREVSRIGSLRLLPAWLARGFDTTVTLGPDHDPFHSSLGSGIFPALDIEELRAMIELLPLLQAKILDLDRSEADGRVFLDSQMIPKLVPQSSGHKVTGYRRLFQSLGGIYLCSPSPEQDRLIMTPLFSEEQWERCNKGESFSVNLRLGPLAEELLLGYSDLHLELWRRFRSEMSATKFLGTEPPLALCRSVWQDLQGLDQALYFRLERAFQWRYLWLHLEGVFGLSLNELFDKMPIRAGRGSNESDFSQQRRQIRRVTKKLVEHGVLLPRVNSSYLAMPVAKDRLIQLIWQLSPRRLQAPDADEFQRSALRVLVSYKLARKISDLIAVLLGPLNSELLSTKFQQCWHSLAGKMELADFSPLASFGSEVLSGLPLYLEWSIRTVPMHPLPLPDEIVKHPISKYLFVPGAEPNFEQFRTFLRLMSEERVTVKRWLDQSLSSVTLSHSHNHEVFKQFFVQSQALLHNIRSRDSIKTKPLESGTRQSTISSSDVVSPRQLPSIKRLVLEELNRLKTSDTHGYELLKNKYFNSLDPNKKKLLQEVQTHMQPHLFDEHLKHSLVKFMLENPAAWRSKAESPRISV